jgi:hypothetical protein
MCGFDLILQWPSGAGRRGGVDSACRLGRHAVAHRSAGAAAFLRLQGLLMSSLSTLEFRLGRINLGSIFPTLELPKAAQAFE